MPKKPRSRPAASPKLPPVLQTTQIDASDAEALRVLHQQRLQTTIALGETQVRNAMLVQQIAKLDLSMVEKIQEAAKRKGIVLEGIDPSRWAYEYQIESGMLQPQTVVPR